MKLEYSEYSFYTYLRVGPNENYKKVAQILATRMKRKGYKHSREQYGSDLKWPQDWYDDGSCGSPMFFIKKAKRL
jgi:hypothetical protein